MPVSGRSSLEVRQQDHTLEASLANPWEQAPLSDLQMRFLSKKHLRPAGHRATLDDGWLPLLKG